jgi:hypothetical protein
MTKSVWTVSAAILAAGGTGAALAQEGRFELRSETMIARSDPFAPDEESILGVGTPFDLETGFDSNNWARWVQPLQGRQVVRFEQQVRVRTYFDRDELNSILLTPRLQYWNTSADNRLQFRLSGAWSHLSRDGDAQWSRPEAEAQLRYRHKGARQLETVARVRVNAYDFADAGLQGLDSTRVRYGLEQFFRNADESLALRLSAFFETAEADDDRFSFDEVRTRAELAWQPDDKTLVVAGLDYRDREYEADFIPLLPQPRADERFTADVRVEREVSERITAFVAAGYLDNASNVALRDYGGETFKVGFRASF